jgi:hypothetical protein
VAKSPEEIMASMVENIAEKTGKSMPQWLALAKKCPSTKFEEVRKYLKNEHGMSHGYAGLVVRALLQPAAGAPAGEELVAAQYAGAKAGIKPIYDSIVNAVKKFGKDVEIAPKKTYVSVRRNKQFGILQAAASRVDVGINLKGVPPAGRLEAAGSFNAMVSHRVRVSSVKEIDAELIGWLRQAYDAS